ncbi:MAG: translation initiation factor IF-3 [Erysipelotrichaceae bacterium]|nr:translation initiation factor IF-3 [Erysipelotrichaceae bacterium]
MRFAQVLVIGPDGKSLGVMSPLRGRQVAETYNLDLVCLNPDAKTPVCKILNYGKYRFESQKKAKEMKRNQRAKEISIHEIQLTPVIGQHDLDTKIKQSLKFLNAGDKIKVTLRFRGRQLSHVEVGEEVIKRFIEGVSEVANVEKEAKLDGKILTCILASKIKK